MAGIIPFSFTVTTDLHTQAAVGENFDNVCAGINNNGGPGDFMISTGDISDAGEGSKSFPDLFRDIVNNRFGNNFRWVPVVGNHDISDESGRGIEWIRSEWAGSNPSDDERETISSYANAGPSGCDTTQYYYFHKGMMFIVMNWYWDGADTATSDRDGIDYTNPDSGGITAAGGRVVDEQLSWLEGLFNTYPDYNKIVCGHGNAFAFADRHSDYDGLGGADQVNRDILWRLFEDNKVVAYIHGHTHERRIDYVDDTYWSGGSSEDSWSYGTSRVAHICAGQTELKWPTTGDQYPTYMGVDIAEDSVTFTIYENQGTWVEIDSTIVSFGGELGHGGVWYYTQDKFGSEWVNKVNNSKGWSVDFNLRVSDVQNSNLLANENSKGKGVGLYVNDGSNQEVVNFLNQEIVFSNAGHSVIYDTTVENDYRLTGKKNNLKLFARENGVPVYSEIANVSFSTKATLNGNALNPISFEDIFGDLHTVWWDDGGDKGSIFYSKFGDSSWSTPEEIVSLDNGVQFPTVVVDSSGIVYVAFESKQTEGSVVGMVYKNNIGWSKPYYTGRDVGYCRHPKMTFDSSSNVCVVWEDSRREHPEIYLDIFLKNSLVWKGDRKLSSNSYGSYRPSVASYMDDLFISWTKMEEDNTSSIEIIKYNAINSSKSSASTVSGISGKADHSNVLANVSGRLFVVWHDNVSGTYQIYASVLSPTFEFLTTATAIVNGNDGARYPVLSEQLLTGSVYVAWQDFKDSVHEGVSVQDIRPSNSAIFVAYYKDGNFVASGTGWNDVMMSFGDERNVYAPSIPVFFGGELPIVYESYLMNSDEYSFVGSENMLLRVKSIYYDISSDSEIFDVSPISEEYGDLDLNPEMATREIRFGDFSDVMNAHYIFKEFKYYLDDAVDPYQIKNIDANTVDVDSISAFDAQVNNYGDTWIVGLCGMYYFVDRYNKLIQIGPEGQILGLVTVDATDAEAVTAEYDELKRFRVIAFDNYNNMYIGGEGGRCRYSTDHVNGFKSLALDGIDQTITSIVFDKDNIMFVGTNNGIYAYNIVINNDPASSPLGIIEATLATPSAFSSLVSKNITSLKIDVNNCLWIGTSDSGVYRFYKDHLLNFTTSHGLPSNVVNDITIRNTAIRYVATANGISKMVGFNFEHILSSKDDTIWSNNVKSIEWKNPNVLLAGTMSRTNQVIINDDDNTYSTVFYEPGSASNVSPDDFNVYYLTDVAGISDGDIIEVYINGNLVHFGYDISSDNRTIRFRSSLDSFDVVEVVVRKDLEEVYTFHRTQDEINNVGNSIVRIESLENLNGDLYAVSSGEENEVKVNDSNSILPFDRLHLDTIPPRFPDPVVGETTPPGVSIGDQVDGSVVRVNITSATDDNGDVIGSGIEGMMISNYDNFTTDGSTAQSFVPFSVSVNHDLGQSLENIVTELLFDSGSGSVISYIVSDNNELYAATSTPAIVYKYNWGTEEWESLFTYDADQYVDFVVKYNDKLLISVGHDTDVSRIYVYNYAESGLSLSVILPITESRAYSSYDLNGKLYIGSGKGSGDEYSSGAGSGGTIYLFDDGAAAGGDPNLTSIVDEVDENVYAMTNVTGSNNLLASTGPEGYIFEIDIETPEAFIVYNGPEALVSLLSSDINNQSMVFAGGEASGIIRKTLFGNNTYDITFRSIPSRISVLKTLKVIDVTDATKNYQTVYAAVGNVIYYLSDGGTWTWKYTHDEIVNDITLDENNNTLYVISSSGITRLNPLVDSKIIYLKLIDRAGNETVINPIPVEKVDITAEPFTDFVDISDLSDFINENKIFELDELGNTSNTIFGDSKFYSADKIEEERGEYVSEIFDGSNDLVKWESISWEAIQLENTTVSIYVRSSTSQNDILVADWLGPFDNSLSAGVNISSMMGQFIQFKAVLTSTEKGITPTFSRASIRAITSESVHFFTTNFTMPDRINKGILTSQKVVPVSADIVFGINTTNSIDWTEYQPVDENRIFNVNQTGHNLRVGIKFISPNRELISPVAYDEYGPYNSNLYVNTVDFDFSNTSGETRSYHYRVTLYSDFGMDDEIFSAYSGDSSDGFSADGVVIPSGGVEITSGSSSNILFSVPGSANITCDTFYFVKIESIYDTAFETFSDANSFVASCTSSFVDNIDFDFTNNEANANYYHFRIKFYQDLERTNEYLTVFSGNDRSGWFVDDVQLSEAGALVGSEKSVNVVYRPTPTDFSTGSIYYLTIEAHDGVNYVFASNSYTFQVRDVQSTEYCGGYSDVPIVKNFSIMFELDNNDFITLNI